MTGHHAMRETILGLLAMCTIALLGCGNPEAAKMTRQREARINYWLNEAAEVERIGARRVDAGFQEMGRIWQHDAEQARRNEAELNELIHFLNTRWHRRLPAYEAAIERELRGKPERIEHIAIRMFY